VTRTDRTKASLEGASGGSVTAGDGATGTLATITRADDGKNQVTYNGIPLYYFAKDAKAGDINGQGIKGVWFLVAPASAAQGGPIMGGVGQGAAAVPSAAPSQSAAGGYTRGPAATPSAAAGGSAASVRPDRELRIHAGEPDGQGRGDGHADEHGRDGPHGHRRQRRVQQRQDRDRALATARNASSTRFRGGRTITGSR
jgi:hypothetical protein